jgi:hypothetical protein
MHIFKPLRRFLCTRLALDRFVTQFIAPFKIMDSSEISDHGRAPGNLKFHVVLAMLNGFPLNFEITESRIGDITVVKRITIFA